MATTLTQQQHKREKCKKEKKENKTKRNYGCNKNKNVCTKIFVCM